ncbi:unnamed protein product [Brachionus calyciflorus]|uniref:type I protein arginine methyltransferase n=1 Tax=Brachionus calyciflorus TaxID=104777 RepID=A0A813M9I2_9BILA|nr:unnamed protein product [Brachionus calyciflorus]
MSQNIRVDFVILSKLDKDGNLNLLHAKPLSVELLNQVPDSVLIFSEDKKNPLFKYSISKDVEYAKMGVNKVIINTNTDSISVQFAKESEKNEFLSKLSEIRNGKRASLFDQRTEESSAVQYFQFYSLLSQQQNMMQDYVRTATYQKAIFDNSVDFEGKVVLDVGAGSGILSFFAAQAGAAKVYAVEASSMAQHANALIKSNGMQNKIKVIAGKIEDIELPEKVDVIISEPMGYMLLNERMLESYLHAKKFLKPNGKMYPTQGDLYVAPFTDEALFMEQAAKANFWTQNSFYGVDLSVLKPVAFDEYFKQPVVDTFDPRIIIAPPVKHSINFLTASESDLLNIEIPIKFDVQAASVVHGLAFWFDVAFIGSTVQTWLSTAPTQPLTHWYQVRCLFPQPFLVTRAAQLVGKVTLKTNKKQSYDVSMVITVEGSTQVFSNTLDLKNPYFRYNGQVALPAGHYHESPTEFYLNQYNAMQNQNYTQSQEHLSNQLADTQFFNGHQNHKNGHHHHAEKASHTAH